jgi:hypothetical protein
MRASSATEKVVTLTKQMKIGPCEQVKVNWQTAALNRSLNAITERLKGSHASLIRRAREQLRER